MKILVIGATGLLGRVLLEQWAGADVTGAGSSDADVRDSTAVQRLLDRHRPQWTVLTAAYTDVDGCEKDPERAVAVNCTGAVNVVRAARDVGSRLLFVSTDYVFDGKKSNPYDVDDLVNPLNHYGRSKAQAEKEIRELMPDSCIVRTSWLFGAHGKCFPATILELAKTRTDLNVVSDQLGSPTLNRDLAGAIVQLVQANARGTFHVTNRGACTWYDFAREILRVAGRSDVKVSPVRTEDFPRPALRPRNSVLSSVSLDRLGISMRPWQLALSDYMIERNKPAREKKAQTSDPVPAGSPQDQGRA